MPTVFQSIYDSHTNAHCVSVVPRQLLQCLQNNDADGTQAEDAASSQPKPQQKTGKPDPRRGGDQQRDDVTPAHRRRRQGQEVLQGGKHQLTQVVSRGYGEDQDV